MPPRHRFLEPIYNVKDGAKCPSSMAEAMKLVCFISGVMLVEPIGIEPMTSSLQS